MQIKLTHTDLLKAVSLFVMAQGINIAGKDLAVTFTSTRKNKGTTADLDITDAKDSAYMPAPIVLQASPEVLVEESKPVVEDVLESPEVEEPEVLQEPANEVVVETAVEVTTPSLFAQPAEPAVELTAHDAALVASLEDDAQAATPALKSLFGNS